ncbi:MAG: hypothetical protein LBV20_00915 [Treponema sp.]|jgi:hypothetical protein|nr:hypothetical protein [Treponema sp.]
MKKCAFFIICLIAFSPQIKALEDRAVVQLMPFSIQGLGSDEAKILEALIQSYIIDLGDSINYETVIEDPASSTELVNPDYIITVSISMVADERILKLEMVNTQTGDVAQFTSNHKTASDLALKSRSLVQEALSGRNETSQPAETSETISGDTIAGTWRGDRGIEMIRLHRNGSGMAIFSSGAQMMLSYSIENNVLDVTQTSPNVDRYYHPVPRNIAQELVKTAEPMTWKMKLYNNGTNLKGTKKATAVEYTEDAVKTFLFGTTRDAEWTKIN